MRVATSVSKRLELEKTWKYLGSRVILDFKFFLIKNTKLKAMQKVITKKYSVSRTRFLNLFP